MKRLISWILTAVALTSCSLGPTAHISATIESAPDSSVVLQKLNYNRLVPVDTIRTDKSGHFDYAVDLTGNEPYFYYLYLGENPVASMILLPSDRVAITVPAEGAFRIEGSEESALLKKVNEDFTAVSGRMNDLAASLGEDATDEEVKAVNTELSKMYVDYKRQAIRYVIEHPRSITSAVVLFQRFSDNLPVFGQETDGLLFKTVRDSLELVYPDSEFLTALRDEVDARARNLELASRFGDASVISFPELALPDADGNTRILSELEGKVIVLSFWSASQDEHKMFNVELAELYRKYHDRGLEVYQVSLDVDKPSWAATVRSQALPWISVNDGLGADSPSVRAYNIDHVPAMFVIDKAGNPVANDVFEKDALERLIVSLL